MPRYNISNIQGNENDDDNQIMRSHFNNITMLCNIIQDSQSLIERQQLRERNIYRRRVNNNNSSSSYNIFNSSSNEEIPRESNYTTTIPSTNNSAQNSSFSQDLDDDSAASLLYFTFESLFPQNITRTPPYRDTSLNIVEIDASNVSLLESNNVTEVCDIYDIKEFRFIESPLNDICPITRDRFYMNQTVYMTRRCRHIFNKSALNMWLERNNTCPYCRTNIFS